MKETKLQSSFLQTIADNNGLKLYLSGLSTGKEATPRSSLYNLVGKTEVLEPEDILKRWQAQLSILRDGNRYEREVFQFDSAQLQKWGPQGEVAPIADLLEEVVYPSFSASRYPKAFQTDLWAFAKRQVVKELHGAGCIGLSPVPLSRVVDDMRARDTLESNSGWPLFTRRSKAEVITQSIQEAEDGRWKTYPAIALFRNYNRKTRLVWMFPMSANLVEGSFFQPLQSILMKSKYAKLFLAPWKGFEEVRRKITNAYRFPHTTIAASDFSSTDAHFKLETSMEVFDVLKECFQPRFRDALKESITYMHEIPLIIGPETMLTGKHGVSSGSNWTNFIETIFDWIFAWYMWLNDDDLRDPFYAIGDDMAWCFTTYSEHFASVLEAKAELVGQVVKADKTTNDPDKVKSLQRLFQRGYLTSNGLVRAVYPTIRALKSLVYPERFHDPKRMHWTKDMEAIRSFMILENCIDHPLFVDFCRFVAAGDPNLKTVARLQPRALNQLYRESQLIPGFNPTYNQEKRNSKLSQFASVKVIAELKQQ